MELVYCVQLLSEQFTTIEGWGNQTGAGSGEQTYPRYHG